MEVLKTATPATIATATPAPMRPGTHDIHVVPTSRGWGIEREGENDLLRLTRTQAEAISFGRYLAMEGSPESLLIHGVDGRIREVRSY